MADQTVTRGHFEASDEIAFRPHGATSLETRRRADRRRTALQAPLSDQKQCVLYLVNGRECRSPWYYSEARARQALALMQAKHGARNCILYRD